MTWSYNPQKLQDSPKDQVRYLIQDTDKSDQLIQDEEINFELSRGGVTTAAYRIARAIAAKFSRKCDETVGKVSKKFSQKADMFLKIADRLETEADDCGALPFAGGLTESGKDSVEDNEDRVDPFFTRHTGDHRRHNENQNRGRVVTEAIQEEEEP